jgi:hypothetical protein
MGRWSWFVGKNLEGGGDDLLESIISTFEWRDDGKQ